MKHAFFGASAAQRWMQCSASAVIDTSQLPEEPKPAAERGTRLHELAETLLRVDSLALVSCAGLSDDDSAAVWPYVEYVREQAGAPDALLALETYGEIAPDLGGTADALVIHPNSRWFEVIDLKTGYHEVRPEENLQLIIYALCAMEVHNLNPADYTGAQLTIVQEKARETVASWWIDMAMLLDWRDRIITRVDAIKAGEVTYAPSETACKWCPAKTLCPALEAIARKTMDDVFDLPPSLETLADKMKMVALVRTWANSIEAEVQALVLTGDRVPGFKAVRGQAGKRKWADQDAARTFLRKHLKASEVEVRSLLSPFRAEKLLKQKGKAKALEGVKEHIQTGAPGALVVVSDDDPRPAVDVYAPATAAEVFGQEETND